MLNHRRGTAGGNLREQTNTASAINRPIEREHSGMRERISVEHLHQIVSILPSRLLQNNFF